MSGFPASQDAPVITTGPSGPQITPAYTSPGQDVTARAGSIVAADLASGWSGTTKITAGSNGVTLTTLAAGTALNVVSTGPFESPSGPYYTNSPGQIFVATSGGLAILGFTQSTPTTFTGISIISGTGAWTVATGGIVYAPSETLNDLYIGDSITRGDGGTLGVYDWATQIATTENKLAGLIAPSTGLVFPFYSDAIYGGLQWSNTASGTQVTTGSPSVTPNAGAGGPLNSSVKLPATGTVGDATAGRTFRRVVLIFQKQTNGDNIVFATTGKVVTSATIDTNGSGLAFWDSGDLGFTGVGTGFTCTTNNTHSSGAGGATVVMVGAIYYQGAGTNGSANLNIAKGGTYSGDWAANTTGWVAFLAMQVASGSPVRRAILCLGVNDQINGVAVTTVAANLTTIINAIKAASPLTEVVLACPYYCGAPARVTFATWQSVWVPAQRAVAVATGATWVDLTARFGDVSSGGDPFGLTVDNIHFGTIAGHGIQSASGTDGQATLAQTFFEKLEYSKAFAVSGTTASGVAADGKITNAVAVGAAGGIGTSWYTNANDANPVATITFAPGGFVPVGLYVGPGGSTGVDTNLTRASATKWSNSNGAGVMKTASDSSAAGAPGAVAFVSGTARTMPQSTTDNMLYIDVTLAGTLTLTMGPTTGAENTVYSAVAVSTAQAFPSVRVPATWLVKVTLTTATITALAVPC